MSIRDQVPRDLVPQNDWHAWEQSINKKTPSWFGAGAGSAIWLRVRHLYSWITGTLGTKIAEGIRGGHINAVALRWLNKNTINSAIETLATDPTVRKETLNNLKTILSFMQSSSKKQAIMLDVQRCFFTHTAPFFSDASHPYTSITWEELSSKDTKGIVELIQEDMWSKESTETVTAFLFMSKTDIHDIMKMLPLWSLVYLFQYSADNLAVLKKLSLQQVGSVLEPLIQTFGREEIGKQLFGGVAILDNYVQTAEDIARLKQIKSWFQAFRTTLKQLITTKFQEGLASPEQIDPALIKYLRSNSNQFGQELLDSLPKSQ